MFRFFTLAAMVALTVSTAKAGFLGDYYTGGTLTQTSGYIGFDELAGSATDLTAGDVVYLYQKFAATDTVGSVQTVMGISAYEVDSLFTPAGLGTRVGANLKAWSGFSNYLSTTLGVDTTDVTVAGTSTFALISSTSNVSLNANGTPTDFTSFSADLVAGITGDDFAQLYLAGDSTFQYQYYDPSINTGSGAAFDIALGLSIESVDDTTVFLSTSATDFDGNTATVDLKFVGAEAQSNAGTFDNFDGTLNNASASMLTLSSVPEPSSIAAMGSLFVVGLVARRRRKSE